MIIFSFNWPRLTSSRYKSLYVTKYGEHFLGTVSEYGLVIYNGLSPQEVFTISFNDETPLHTRSDA